MTEFKQVAIVNLVEDYGKKDYAFALYKEEWELITSKDYMHNPVYVVVNARNRNNNLVLNIQQKSMKILIIWRIL